MAAAGAGADWRSGGRISCFTAAHRLLAAPLQGLLTHSGPGANQLVARLAQEVDLVSDAKHPAESAAVGRRFGPGAGRWGGTETPSEPPALQSGLVSYSHKMSSSAASLSAGTDAAGFHSGSLDAANSGPDADGTHPVCCQEEQKFPLEPGRTGPLVPKLD